MTVTSQLWFSSDSRGMITAEAYHRDGDGNIDRSRPGHFSVTNGSFADFGVHLNSGERLRGFEVNSRTGQA